MNFKFYKLPFLAAITLCCLSACQSTSKTKTATGYVTFKSEYQNYQKALKTKELKEAQRALEQMFELSSSNETYFKLSGNLLANSLYTGVFGHFEQQRFIDVAQILGEDLNAQLQFGLKKINNYYTYQKEAPKALSKLHQKAIQYCPDSNIVSKQVITPHNAALHYLNSIDCVAYFLIESAKARALMAQHFEYIGARENSKIKSLGFSLYDIPVADYSKLTLNEQQALLSAKKQVYGYSSSGTEPNFNMSTSPGEVESEENMNKFFELLKLAENNLTTNLAKVTALSQELSDVNNVKAQTIPRVLYHMIQMSMLQNNLAVFDSYVKQMNDANYLTKDNNTYLNQLRLSILYDNKQYLDGLLFAEKLFKTIN